MTGVKTDSTINPTACNKHSSRTLISQLTHWLWQGVQEEKLYRPIPEFSVIRHQQLICGAMVRAVFLSNERLLGAALAMGAIIARQKRYRAHGIRQTTVLLITAELLGCLARTFCRSGCGSNIGSGGCARSLCFGRWLCSVA